MTLNDAEFETCFNQDGESDRDISEEYDDQMDTIVDLKILLDKLRAENNDLQSKVFSQNDTIKAQADLIKALKAEFQALGASLCQTAGVCLNIAR